MDIHELEKEIEGILFASGEPVEMERIAAVLGIDMLTLQNTVDCMSDQYVYQNRGIRLIKLDRSLQLCSAPELADIIRLTLETRKPPQLSQAALEVLAIIAYFQPVTRLFIEEIRGVDSSYTVNLLQERGLIEVCGRMSVPGRPAMFRTTAAFLRTFAIASLKELPPLPEMNYEDEDGQIKLLQALQNLQNQDGVNG